MAKVKVTVTMPREVWKALQIACLERPEAEKTKPSWVITALVRQQLTQWGYTLHEERTDVCR